MNKDFLELAEKLRDLPLKKVIKLYKKTKNKRIIVARCYYDLKFFAKFFFCETIIESDGTKKKIGHTKDPFNDLHLDYFKEFNPNEEKVRKVFQASRGSAKTTLLCLIDPLHRACYATEKYQLILSSTTPLARGKSKDIHREVGLNEKLREFYGLDLDDKRASTETFLVRSSFGKCFFHAQGFFSQIRGAKFGSERPTRILYDDVTHGEHVFSEDQREKAKRQFKTDILQACQPGTSHIFLGTTIHSQDLLTELSKDPLWDSKTYKAIKVWPKNMSKWEEWEEIWRDPSITPRQKKEKARLFYVEHKKEMDEGAEVLWPEREDLYWLMVNRITVGRREFGAEKQMEPYLTEDSLFQNISWFYIDRREIDGIMTQGYYIEKHKKFIPFESGRFQRFYALDPATGERKKQTQKKTLSQSARVIADKDLDTGNIYIREARMDRKAPSKIIYEMYDLHNQNEFEKMGFEENLFKDLFHEHIESIKKEWVNKNGFTMDLPFASIYNDHPKEERIYSIEPLVTSGTLLFNKHMNPDYLTQLQDYPNCDHNDGLDATEILTRIADPRAKLTSYSFPSLVRRH